MSYLAELVAATQRRVDETKIKLTDDVLETRIAAAESPRGFTAALKGASGPALIAEIKRRSPSKGALNEDLDAGTLAQAYARGGAVAISVLTEPDFFSGSLEDMAAARRAGLPVLRKDFILDPIQVLESRAESADAILLVVRTIGAELAELFTAARSLGMDVLVEVFDEADLERALEVGADLIGINHRDLETFEVDPDRTAKLRPQIPANHTVVALSGVATAADIAELAAAGADAFLVGEALVTAPDPEAAVRSLVGR